MPQAGPFHYEDDRCSPDFVPRAYRRLLDILAPYYTGGRLTRHVVQTTSSRSVVSLRLIDWFVTNYAKKKQTCWVLRDQNGNDVVVQAHQLYVTELRKWKRGLFDPFKRRARVRYRSDGHWYTTTIAQLNFMRFANECGLYGYVTKNRTEIEADMKAASRTRRRQKQRKTLSRPPSTVLHLDHPTRLVA